MTLATELIAVAKSLHVPKATDAALRRCISTAYYAVFHALGEAVAEPYSAPARLMVSRMVAHTDAVRVAKDVIGQQRLPWLANRPACHADIMTFCDNYKRLYNARERADYDLTYQPTTHHATEFIDRAEEALRSLVSAKANCPTQLEALCVAVIASSNARNRMAGP